jgi:hypothetical protein
MKKVKVVLLSTVLAFSVATATNAADLYEGGGSLKDDVLYMPPMTWGGFYVGGHLGGGFEDDYCYPTQYIRDDKDKGPREEHKCSRRLVLGGRLQV